MTVVCALCHSAFLFLLYNINKLHFCCKCFSRMFYLRFYAHCTLHGCITLLCGSHFFALISYISEPIPTHLLYVQPFLLTHIMPAFKTEKKSQNKWCICRVELFQTNPIYLHLVTLSPHLSDFLNLSNCICRRINSCPYFEKLQIKIVSISG